SAVHPDDRESLIQGWQKSTKVQEESFSEYRFLHGDGKIYWVMGQAIPETNHENQIVGYIGTITDITERKEAEKALQEKERKFKELFDHAPIGYHELDIEGRITRINRTELNMLGYTEEEMVGQFVWKFVGSEESSRQRVLEKLNGTLLPSQSEERFYRRKDLKILPVLSEEMILRDSMDKIIGIRTTIQDITERKRAEEEIAMLAHSLKSINECVSITDMEDNLIFVNESFLRTYGYDRDELIGKNMLLVRSPNNPLELVKEILPATINGGWKGELWNKRKDGSEFPIHLSTTIITDKEHNPLGLIGVATDITERKRVEKELIEAKEFAEQSNKMKDAFIANISHEIRTPLNGILGMTSIIKEIYSQNMSDEEEVCFAAIDKSSERIIRTIDLILNYSQLETGNFTLIPQQMELSSICKNLVNKYLAAAKSKSLSLSFDDIIGATFISADEYSITQVISNLIENAVIYTKSGFVKVQLYRNQQNEISLDITDSGIGIGDEYLDHIFESFRQEQMGYSRPYEGLGLGLAVVKKILDLHHASISVKSKKGEGTTFTINFGRKIQNTGKKNVTSKNIAKIEITKAQIDHLILLVEDDKINQETIKRFITKKYNILVADSHNSVMEILADNNVDLILMDISLQGSKNGLEITKELKASEKYKHIPIIAATAHAFERDHQAALEAGCNDYIAKPFLSAQLLNKIDKFMK
ncbi:MAG: PAS domain S-box protein, partial [Ignavibacteria bacterium]|nr:PAS domain S-box protein [Ignavibacteria bacterium]